MKLFDFGIILPVVMLLWLVYSIWITPSYSRYVTMKLFDLGIILAVVMLPWLVYSIWITP